MAIDKTNTGMPGPNPAATGPSGLDALRKNGTNGGDRGFMGGADSAEFKRALDQVIGPVVTPQAKAPPTSTTGAGASVGQPGTATLTRPTVAPNVASSLASGPALKFSNHAIERMHSRGITFQPEQMKSIQDAVAKAAQKGSKDTLVLTGESALIVSVKNNTVVTVMDKAAMKDNVFTNIDSTVVI